MADAIRFRKLLPVAQCAVTAVFGGVGLWQRSQILNRPIWGNQTLWDTTARFHVYPWPLRFAALLNVPALMGGSLLASVGVSWVLPEVVSLALVPLFWFWVGSRLDRRFCQASESATSRTPWVLLIALTLVSLAGALLPFRYLPYGLALWIVAGVVFLWLTRVKREKNPTVIAP